MDVLLSWLSHWQGAVAVVLVLGGLIFFHELGHFSVARLFGIGVRTFSLGFGPKLWGKQVGKTEYRLSLVPLGGYVSMVGEDGEEEDPEVLARDASNNVTFDSSESFAFRPAWQRMLVVLAGPVANIVLAFLIYWGVALFAGQSFLEPIIGTVVADSPAARAELKPGDRIVQIDGKPIQEWSEVVEGIGAGQGQPVRLMLERDEGRELVLLTTEITPEAKTRKNIFGEEKPAWLIGITASGTYGTRELGAVDALTTGFSQTWGMVSFTFESFKKLFERVVPLDQVGGPILIAQMVGQQAEYGVTGVLLMAALISVNLGILNLLPVPVLDGGHIMFALIEIVRRRPVTDGVRDFATKMGMMLLLGLMLLATWNDLVRLFS
ncbi:MAG TPA: RIP metalloprotease RseP [Candidatus Avidesulfovibrio excrementigallinarum]|nr:RIP metalloprotease RseP [Candidatus Avidesulfovibrio excrementigallinarum]